MNFANLRRIPFLQAPALQQLLAIPPYTLGRELSPANVWLGSRGTVTSLHSDPSDNLLCQVDHAPFIMPCPSTLATLSRTTFQPLRALLTDCFASRWPVSSTSDCTI